jgi:release factor glutamine methyltransferase
MHQKEFHQLRRQAEEKLKEAGIDTPATEVELILEYLLDVKRVDIYLHGHKLIDEKTLSRFDKIIEKRITRYPLQYILGETHFYARKFLVNPDVMVPAPETETLCELAIKYIKNERLKSVEILDVGTGCGVIAVTMACELSDTWITATDISQAAVAMARKNAAIHAVESRIRFLKADVFSGIGPGEKFDLILSNPPYISEKEYANLPPEVLTDPKISLLGGVEGLDVIKRLIEGAPDHLKDSGRLMFEIGYNQAELIANTAEKDTRYRSISVIQDLNDIDRVVILSI